MLQEPTLSPVPTPWLEGQTPLPAPTPWLEGQIQLMAPTPWLEGQIQLMAPTLLEGQTPVLAPTMMEGQIRLPAPTLLEGRPQPPAPTRSLEGHPVGGPNPGTGTNPVGEPNPVTGTNPVGGTNTATGTNPVVGGPHPPTGTNPPVGVPNVGLDPFPFPFFNPYAFAGHPASFPEYPAGAVPMGSAGIGIGGSGAVGTTGGRMTGTIKTFDDLLMLVGCAPPLIAVMKNSNITSLERFLTWSESEVDKMIKTFRKGGVEILPDVEKYLQLMVGEAQIRHQTHRVLTDMHSATIDDFEQWLYRQSEKRSSRTRPLQACQMHIPFPRIG
jgi:biotin operon repressor